jgi:hypothetical protein
MAHSPRGRGLTVAALLFAALAVSNLMKPLEMYPDHGLVFFGSRLRGMANAVAGPLFGLFLLAYAGGIWGMRRFALPMGLLYAVYVVINLITFRLWGPIQPGVGSVIFGLAYAAVAIGVSSGTAWTLMRRRAELV